MAKNVAFSSAGKSLQVLFDESILEGEVSHEVWAYAWARSIAYAWECEENKQQLLRHPEKVLARFNYKMPNGVKLVVIEANEKLMEGGNELEPAFKSRLIESIEKSNRDREGNVSYNAGNHDDYAAYKIHVDPETGEYLQDGKFALEVRPSRRNPDELEFAKKERTPVNGWIDIPELNVQGDCESSIELKGGLVLDDGEGGKYWLSDMDEQLQQEVLTIYSNDENDRNIVKSLPVDLFLDGEVVEVDGVKVRKIPAFYRLSGILIKALPPRPEVETSGDASDPKIVDRSAMSLTEYDALGMIYPFTS